MLLTLKLKVLPADFPEGMALSTVRVSVAVLNMQERPESRLEREEQLTDVGSAINGLCWDERASTFHLGKMT